MKYTLVAVILALTVCSTAAAHGGGGALGFLSTVTRVSPADVTGLNLVILDSDDRLELTNATAKPLVIFGYEGEPYLSFRNGRVYRNSRSPATYLNDDRFGKVALPPQADPKAAPDWVEVGQRETYDWHDHRIHWMSPTLPPKIEAAKDQPQHVFDWTIPGALDGRPLRISGSLDYVPPPSGRPWVIVAIGVFILLAGGAAISLRHRRAALADR